MLLTSVDHGPVANCRRRGRTPGRLTCPSNGHKHSVWPAPKLLTTSDYLSLILLT